MALVLTTYGSQSMLRAFLRQQPWETWFGLFQNDWQPREYSTIVSLVPCSFDGYYGLSRVSLWTDPGISGVFAVSSAPALIWYRTAGIQSNWVFGYYVVDQLGQLLWAERIGDYPAPMIQVGSSFQVIPTISQTSRFTGA